MISCEKCQESFLEALYDELEADQRRRLAEHLTRCPHCSTEFAALRETLQLLQQRKRREPEESFWNGVWDNFVNRIDPKSAGPVVKTRRAWPFQPRWVFQFAAAIALIVVGFWIGRHYGDDKPPEAAKTITATAPQTLDDRVDRYLQRSKLLLLGLANLDPSQEEVSSFDFTPEIMVCRELIQETYWLKSALDEARHQPMLELLSDLEVILLQISNLKYSNRSFDVELAKMGIRSKALLFRINLEEIERTADRPSSSGGRSKISRRSRNLG